MFKECEKLNKIKKLNFFLRHVVTATKCKLLVAIVETYALALIYLFFLVAEFCMSNLTALYVQNC